MVEVNYDVKILKGKPFEKILDDEDKIIRRDNTVEIVFYNEDGSIQKTAEYGYITMDEIKQCIRKREKVLLDFCYVKELDIQHTKISSISAVGVFFGGEVNFRDAVFSGETNFSEAVFNGEADFSEAKFSEASFFNAVFNSEADFYGAVFNGRADFYGAVFIGEAIFFKAEFSDETIFTTAVFSDVVSFKAVLFSGEASKASFHEAVFITEAYFFKAEFNGEANFSDAVFNSQAIFIEAKFSNEVDFSGAEFNMKTTFLDAIISSTIIYDYIIFNEHINMAFKKCNELVISNCTIEKTIDLGGIYLNKLCLLGTKNLGQIFLNWERNNIKKAIIAYAKEKELPYYEIAEQFNLLKVNFNRIGQYEKEDKAYVEYRRNETLSELHDENSNKFKRKIRYYYKKFVYDFIGEYATNPLKILLSLCISIVGFGVIYKLLGVGSGEFGEGILRNFFACLYYSATASFTVGFANGRILVAGLAIVEGFIGLFLMSYFTVAFARKVLR